MSEIVQLCGYFAIVFAVSMGAGYFLTTMRGKRKLGKPIQGATLQIRASSGIYRSKFEGENPNGWMISAPLRRDAYVPLRVGEKLTVIAPTDKGLRSFETEIISRSSETHLLTIQTPQQMSAVERRAGARVDRFLNPNAAIEGKAATLLDLSPGGARLVAEEPIRRGERAALDLPGMGRVFGWILESTQSSPGYVLRLRFEEPLGQVQGDGRR